MKIETYGKIPKGLLDSCNRVNKRIGCLAVYQIGNEPENACDDYRNDYWIFLTSGFETSDNPTCGTIHESTVELCRKKLSLIRREEK